MFARCGRPATGVRGINLDKDDHLVALAVVDPGATLLVAGENGIGKRTAFDEYRVQTRGGKGIITMKHERQDGASRRCSHRYRQGRNHASHPAGPNGIRTPVKDIVEAGRNTQGVKLVNLQYWR